MALNLDKVKFVLTKRNINDIPCNVAFAMDVSGSIKWLYDNGTIQAVTERIATIAMTVDVDKQLDFLVFDDMAHELEAITEQNLIGYINKYVLKNRGLWNGTKYAPAIKMICEAVSPTPVPEKKGFFSAFKRAKPVISTTDKNLPPVLAILITDGQNFDKEDTIRVLEKAQSLNIYWQLVGIGKDTSQFDFIRQMGDRYPNVGYIPITDIAAIPEEDLYDALLNDEFADWIRKFK